MKTLTTLLALALFCATAYGQTIKSLGYNTASGDVVYPGTNRLAFTNQVQIGFSGSGGIIIEPEGTLFFFDYEGSRDFFVFDNGVGGADEARARTNLGLGWPALTNSNSATSLLGFTTNGEVVANTGTNVLTFTNAVAFNGSPDFLTINGTTISASSLGELIFDEARFAIGNDSVWDWANSDFRLFVPLVFENPQDAATSRTNLSLGLPALTNTSNVTMMRALAGSTNTNAPFSGSVVVDTNTLVFTNGILLEVQ